MMTYACPSCKKHSDWPDDWRGEQVDCPHCGQRLHLSAPRRDNDRRYRDEDDGERLEEASRRSRRDDDDRDVRRRDSRDDDHDIRRRDYRDEDDRDERDDRSRRRRSVVECPECGCRGRPRESKELSESSWVLIVIGIFFWPLLILGVLMRDTWEVCRECGYKIRKVGGTSIG